MLQRPRFKPHLRVEVVPGEGVFLLSDLAQTVLQGRLYEMVAPCLDGRSVEEICAQLRDCASPAHVLYTLERLDQKGYLAEDDAGLPPGEAALWSIQHIDPAVAARRLAETPVAVQTAGDVDAEPLRVLLRALRIQLAEQGVLTVVATDSYLRSDLRTCNRQALDAGRPWLLLKPVGCQLWLGPLFLPGRTGCWECLAQRLRAVSPVAGYLEAKRGHTGLSTVDHCQTPATLQAAWALAAHAIATWVASGELAALAGTVRTLDMLTGQGQVHTLVRQPACPACATGGPGKATATPLVLQSSRKTLTHDGGHRGLSPEQTLERYGHHISPITGAVPHLERASASGAGVLHVYMSGYNAASRPRNLRGLRSDLRDSNCGKGTTETQARASALCEGLERHCAIFHGDEPRRTARFRDLGQAAIHPNACLLFSDRQYRQRNDGSARDTRYNTIPVPFDRDATIEWTPVWSLTREESRLLPTSFCYLHYPQSCSQAFCWGDSNGNAAGNSREEAVLQGFLELVERDSVALWWYNRVRPPGVDLDSFGEPYVGELRAFLGSRGRDLWALDLTADLGIPAFAALSRRLEGAPEQIVFGFGAHLDARVGLLRAVTEMNQMLAQVLDVSPGELPDSLTDRATVDWMQSATLANQPYLVSCPGPARIASSYPPCRTDDLRDDVVACQALVERQGLELLVLDQTRPEIGLPVVKVIVPGLRHFWARFAPGRLYDIPVRLGWLPRPLSEEELNPIPMFW
jgi:ribosomal protein S12 methylthiotransferase accessory factor